MKSTKIEPFELKLKLAKANLKTALRAVRLAEAALVGALLREAKRALKEKMGK